MAEAKALVNNVQVSDMGIPFVLLSPAKTAFGPATFHRSTGADRSRVQQPMTRHSTVSGRRARRSAWGQMCVMFVSTAAGMEAARQRFAGKHRRSRRRQRTGVTSRQASVSEMSKQARDMRKSMEENEDLRLMMQGLRGSGLNDSDRQADGVVMQLVDVGKDDETGLPLRYDAEELEEYFSARPGMQALRIFQVVSTSYPLIGGVIWDKITGADSTESEVRRAAQFNSVVTSLGPFFIKLGQALSIRPDVLSPRAMVELQKLCDKVPSYPSEMAFNTFRKELSERVGKDTTVEDIFETITPEPVAAASLGQVYKATLREPKGVEVAVKIQRPAVLETVSLDLYLARKGAMFLKWLSDIGVRDSRRTNFVALLDEFASRIYEELDYVKECENGLQVEKDMAELTRVVIPKNYAQYCTRKVHVAAWMEGEKLSQSGADDVRELVNVGVIAYLTQLLDKGLFHADPHPGNMLRTPDGKLGILDFGLMTQITEEQRYGMVEAIAHLVHRDYDQIGADFKRLDFIPKEVDVEPIVPALGRVFDAALAGGGAKGINFNELSADLAQITFEYPFKIPPYFALIIRAIGVLEGIALVGDPDFAIVDEAYPYLSKQLLTNPSDRLRATFRYMVYGREGVFDADRLIDLLRAFEAFSAVQKPVLETGGSHDGSADASSPASAGSSSTAVGLVQDTQQTDPRLRLQQMRGSRAGDRPTSWATATNSNQAGEVREALAFLFSEDGEFFRSFLVEETVKGVDCLGRGGLQELNRQLLQSSPIMRIPGVSQAIASSPLGALGDLFAPPLTQEEEKVVQNTQKLFNFLAGGSPDGEASESGDTQQLLQASASTVRMFREDPELARGAREFAGQLARRLFEVVNTRALRRLADGIDGGSRRPLPA
mmetsp:Transcript_34857/g.81446  ORF Transcript_34857/g.81446 Transcript_34857/m.81446 type:complete len:889 (-) Transcript_34857:141-2807(-)